MLNSEPAEGVIRQFVEHRLNREREADGAFFREIVRGVVARRDELDRMLAGALTTGREVDRLEIVLRVLLEAGAWELAERAEIPFRVVISEYVQLASSFFSERETSVVNAVLDRLAQGLREEEIAAQAP